MAETLDEHTTIAAAMLLGCTVTANGVTIRLTEVEAYAGVGEDPGSHTHRGPTPRTAPMFGPSGHTYVYFTYGVHWCLNITARPTGHASGVLLRAGEVIDGIDTARARRPRSTDRDLARGPARLARALDITGADTGTPALDGTGPVHLRDPATPPTALANGPRTGISGTAAATPWRFWIPGEPTVSPYRAHTPRNRSRATPRHRPESTA
ncbi:DNA-3-methyladenine glycosylase [Actinorhabdospora filicis]|uniref:DNA-3-methyladenine glycosylase n=1 Tax=Actinorhabdospora filicis TaxID=1785913 RepID=UPI0025546FA3|nr:DNA-3-methyladenine glycosylase [Actinorhabdospora filicis]